MKIPTDPADNTNSYVTFHSKENSSGNKAYLVFNPDGSGIGSNQTQSGINYRITDKSLTISEIAPQSKVKITDLSGKTVYSVIANNTLDYTFVNGGIYILSVQNDVNASSIKLLVK